MAAKLQTNGSFPFLSAPAALNTPTDKEPGEGEEVICLAAGCFWGVDKSFRSIPGVIATAADYMGGELENPSYELVCTNTAGYAETLRVVYPMEATCATEITSRFFEIHGPTQVNRQDNDIGTQYRSAIRMTTSEQLGTALRARDAYQEELVSHDFYAIATEITPVQDTSLF